MVLAPRHFESAFWNLDCNLDLALSHRGHANPRKRTSQERNLPDGLWCVYIGHVLTLNFRLCCCLPWHWQHKDRKAGRRRTMIWLIRLHHVTDGEESLKCRSMCLEGRQCGQRYAWR